jgi:hypothetical protein
MLRIEKRKLRTRRAGDHHREKAPEHGTVAEMEQQKGQGEESDPQGGELHPENRPLGGRLARFGAQADGEEDGEHEGRRKARTTASRIPTERSRIAQVLPVGNEVCPGEIIHLHFYRRFY